MVDALDQVMRAILPGRRFHPALHHTITLMIVAVWFCACRPVASVPTAVPSPTTAYSAPATATLAPKDTTTAIAPDPTMAPSVTGTPSNSHREIIVIQTNDEHGALLPEVQKDFLMGGAAYCDAAWLAQGYDPRQNSDNVLLLSGGDNWTGPAISTWFKGESTVEAMNAMGYRASAIGNHEFDFGQDVVRARMAQANFPYLAANLYRQDTQELVDWVQPYAVLEVNGVGVGVIGLALQSTPQVTAAKNLQGLTFGAYEPALRRWVPVMRRQGAQVIVVQAHICSDALLTLADQVHDLGITLFHGAHCHRSATVQMGNVFVGAGSSSWRDYVVTRLVYDIARREVIGGEQRVVDVLWPKAAQDRIRPHPEVQAATTKWEERVQVVLGETIGHTATGLPLGSPALQNLLVDSWLWAYPQADIAISNVGGFRQGLESGSVTLGDIVGVLPFDNELLDLTVTGEQVESILKAISENIVVAGIARDSAGRLILTRTGQPLERSATYRLLTTDYMVGNSKYPFQRYDASPYETSIPWRQPVIDWIKAQQSDPSRPIEKLIDNSPRRIW